MKKDEIDEERDSHGEIITSWAKQARDSIQYYHTGNSSSLCSFATFATEPGAPHLPLCAVHVLPFN